MGVMGPLFKRIRGEKGIFLYTTWCCAYFQGFGLAFSVAVPLEVEWLKTLLGLLAYSVLYRGLS